MFEFLVEPWTWGDWMWRGMLASVLVAVPCAVLGVFLYLRRMSMISDALAHVALPGVVAAFLLTGSFDGFGLLVGALIAGIGSSVLIETISRKTKLKQDASIGIVFTTLFAAGIIGLSTFARDVHLDADCILFGNVLGISDHSLMTMAIVAPIILGLVAVFFRWLSAVAFDAEQAAAIGIPVALVHYGLMAATSTTAVVGFEAVGAILVVAFIIIPAATAHLVSDRLHTMIAHAIAVSVASVIVGMYSSVWFNCSSAGAIVVVMGIIYGATFLFAPRHGRATKWFLNRSRATRRRSVEPQLGE